MILKAARKVREKRPVVHNITNYVAAAGCADITLAVGASPIMADEPEESGEVTLICDALVINTGTISERRLKAMLISGKAAKEKDIPIVFDPVGAGVSGYRTEAVKKILDTVRPDIIRLNASELQSLCTGDKNTYGVDAAGTEGINMIFSLAKRLASSRGAVVSVSGERDIVTDGNLSALIAGGHGMMRSITGAGCMLSSVIGAFAAANPENILNAVIAASAVYGVCGKRAYRDGIGTGTYRRNFFDEMTNPVLEDIEIEYK